jgi:hypothetical protein
MDLYNELLGLIDLFDHNHIDYALCGGVAVAFHGYPRFTKDIDVLIQAEDLDKVLKIIEGQGFTFLAGPLPFDVGKPNERVVHRVSKIEGAEVLTLDLVLVSPVFQDVWQQRELFEWQGRHVPIVSAHGLAKMKRLAGRDQDLLDLKQLGFIEEQDNDEHTQDNSSNKDS